MRRERRLPPLPTRLTAHVFDELMVGEIPPSPFAERGQDQVTRRAA
jgi:hypothetical protein